MNRFLTLIAAFALICSAANTVDVQAKDKSTDPVAADNTAKNKGDAKDENSITPGDQPNTKVELAVTTKIRKAIIGKKGYSTNAQNVKIVTHDGFVTLRGPVDSQNEKDSIETIAKKYSGAFKVVNELEVKTKG